MTVAWAYWRSSAHKDQSLPVPQALPTNVEKQLSGYSYTRSVEGRQIFTVHAARTVAFKQGGSMVLEDVFVEVFGREGNRHDVLRTRQCEYNSQSGDFFSPGTAEIELNAPGGGLSGSDVPPGRPAVRRRQPVYLETSKLSFKQGGSLVTTDEPVRFHIGPASGSARGMTYPTQAGWLELKKSVIVEVHPGGGGPAAAREPVRLAANRLRYDRPRLESGTVALAGPVEIVQANRRVLAERGTVSLDTRNRVTQAVVEGNVRAFDSSEVNAITGSADRVQTHFNPATGQLIAILAEGNVVGESRRGRNWETLSRVVAQQVEITFQGNHAQPQRGSALGNVQLTLDSTDRGTAGSSRQRAADTLSAERKSLSAGQIKFDFRPTGGFLRDMQTVGAGKLVLVPADPKLGERVITAGQLLMTFDGRGRLETLRGFPQTRIIFQPAKNAPPGSPSQVGSSDRMEATFDPSTQTFLQVEQDGNFQFQEGDRQATAERADYLSSTQAFTLSGHPLTWDMNTRTSAEHILIDLRADTAEGVAKVQSTHFGSTGEAAAGPSSPRPTGAGDPTHVLADRMVAERRSQIVHYEGHVRAWQRTDVVEASALDVHRTERRMSSGSRVQTSHFQAAPRVQGASATSGPQRDHRPVTIRADRLDYFDEGRKAAYRGNVQLQTENTSLEANRMDVYFSNAKTAQASEVERAVADGHVKVVQPARRASGEHADYDAAAGRILLTGGPPTLYDLDKGFTTGQRLTFFVHDDRLIVDGGDQSPTLSRHRVTQ